ncbi:MAG: dynamin, partial [Leptolyngbya sp. SIO3F4]|nr:dynamin [Leptolyngbya sp. SIO3F4]
MAASQHSHIIATLQKAVGLLDPNDAEIKANILRQCQFLAYPNLRITVFGPFNYGKSTLLNALLGEKTLPVDLVPTTGAAITIIYGPKLTSRIILKDGNILEEQGTELLQRYATLDEQRQMQQAVSTVEVEYPHPLLKLGVELVDLPGTDDQIANSQLVYTQLLEADVIIQLLDGRKLMTLMEQDHLKDWLMERGITTVLFVINFLNLIEPEERNRVMERMQVIAQDFRTNLPQEVNNLYAVDALPALRARLKGDTAAVTESGLLTLESALHTLVEKRLPDLVSHRIHRLLPFVTQGQRSLQQQLQVLEQSPLPRRAAIQQRVQQLMQTGFQQSVTDLFNWLQLANLLGCYQQSLSTALENGNASQWLAKILYPTWEQKRRAVVEWMYKACDFFEKPYPEDLWVAWQQAKKDSSQSIQEISQTYLSNFSSVALIALDSYQNTARTRRGSRPTA